jgi:hypothetical protein
MAVDAVRSHGRIIDVDFEKEPCSHSLLVVAVSVGEVSGPLFIAVQNWKLSVLVTPFRRNETWIVLCDGES